MVLGAGCLVLGAYSPIRVYSVGVLAEIYRGMVRWGRDGDGGLYRCWVPCWTQKSVSLERDAYLAVLGAWVLGARCLVLGAWCPVPEVPRVPSPLLGHFCPKLPR